MFIYGMHVGDGIYRYVGMTKLSIRERMYNHKHSSLNPKTPVHWWIRKHGFDSVIVDTLDTAENLDELRDLEILWVAKLRGEGFPLLNMTDGGEGVLNPSEATREKYRLARSGEKNHRWGTTWNENQAAAMSEWNARRKGLGLASGENNPRAKITESQVVQIREMYESGWSSSKIAEKFGISKPTAWQVATRKTWQHVK